MKKIYLFLFLLAPLVLGFTSCSDNDDDHDYVKLNLDNFDLSDGVAVTGGKYWAKTYVDEANVTSGIFTFSHTAPYTEAYDGFTVSNVANNTDYTGDDAGGTWYPDNQFASITKGSVAGEGKPYLVNYGHGLSYGSSVSEPLAGKEFTESDFTSWVKVGTVNDRYKAHSVYVTNNSLAYYSIKGGDGYGKAFESGDYFKLNVHGVNADMEITAPVTFYLADYRNGKSAIADQWQQINLSSLGEVSYLLFTLESSDNNDYGMKTPAYFCLDRLVVDKLN